ncbi:MAG: alpha/beta fold hydrolase [Pseudonocardiaceae bacterium]|nr:MAG: alpha/beta fold hydrolase [Pseudonocardiaceae bacterium]
MPMGGLTKEETDRFADVGGIRIHYNEAGSGPALICTHGGGPGANAWDNTRWAFDALAEHFRVILMDMPGFGESEKGVSRHGVPVDVFCARLQRDLMDVLGIERSHLYGSSAFSPAALRFGLAYPEHVGKIVIQAYAPGHEPGLTEGIRSLVDFAADPTMQNMERMMELFTPRSQFRPRELVEARYHAATAPGHLESRKEFAHHANSDLTEDIAALRAEVLVVWGARDGMIPVEGALAALNRIPNVRALLWGGDSGHFVAHEQAEEFARFVVDFLTH